MKISSFIVRTTGRNQMNHSFRDELKCPRHQQPGDRSSEREIREMLWHRQKMLRQRRNVSRGATRRNYSLIRVTKRKPTPSSEAEATKTVQALISWAIRTNGSTVGRLKSSSLHFAFSWTTSGLYLLISLFRWMSPSMIADAFLVRCPRPRLMTATGLFQRSWISQCHSLSLGEAFSKVGVYDYSVSVAVSLLCF